MPTPIAPISFSQIRAEFGGGVPDSLSEYYRGGVNVPIGQATSSVDGVPVSTSGTIRVGMFRNLTKAVPIVLNINANTLDYNIFTAAGSPSGIVNVTVNIAAGVYVVGTNPSGFAMVTGSGWHASSTILVNLTSTSVIMGRGGAGGAGGYVGSGGAGGGGGYAFYAQRPVTINNGGYIWGGSGGGGGGASYYIGKGWVGGGGGGGGRANAPGGAGGFGSNNGGTATLSAGGAGGTAGSGSPSNGGAGGNGSAGSAGVGSPWYAGGAGGTLGGAVSGNAQITWTATGSRVGPLYS